MTPAVVGRSSTCRLAWLAILLGPLAFTGGCPPASDSSDLDSGNGPNTPTNADGDTDTTADHPGTIIADHLAAASFDSIPAQYVEDVQSRYRIFYGHTSHGSQIVTGMEMIYGEDGRYAFNAGAGSLSVEEEWTDLGYEGDLGWVDVTRDVLDAPGSDINLVMWSWCGGVSDNTSAGINAYLDATNQLENDYPDVVFVYMTGHLDGTGPDRNLYARNNQIRDYCRSNGKVLFDFADIESYDPDGNYHAWGSDWCEWCDTWCASHACPGCDDCAHSVCFNCYQKGKAFWWMMARIAGWDGT
jgi:hypothetical protein